jgi:uridylate kinase
LPGRRFSRILLKLSGEALSDGEAQFGHERLTALARAIADVAAGGVQVGIVLGAGNIFRARSANLEVIDRVTADHVGMLATVMNAAVLGSYLRRAGVAARVFSPRPVPPLSEEFAPVAARALLESGHVVLCGGGTGNPFFTTDTAAALRAVELGAEALLKATQVDGVYDRDPRRDPGARRLDRLSYDQVLARRLGVMDLTAVALCAEQNLPIVVFDISEPENLGRVLRGELQGSLIAKES